MVDLSLIVLSKTNSDAVFNMTNTCFKTFIESAEKANKSYEIILVESELNSTYNFEIPQLKTIKPESVFNFHKFLNIGIKVSKAHNYILSNNDLVFDENWLVELFKVADAHPEIDSFSPYDKFSNKLPKTIIEAKDYVCGYEIQKHLSGWCIFTRSKVFSKLKSLDERFDFYYADFDYAMDLQKYNIKHALVTKSEVLHLESMSTEKVEKQDFELPKRTPKYIIEQNWTWVLENKNMIEGLIIFHDKWGERKILKLKLYIAQRLQRLGLGMLNRFILTNK